MDSANYCGLTEAQRNANAEFIYDYLSSQGWSKNAICGLLGNVEKESQLNPGAWQNNQGVTSNPKSGYGLIQWTPSDKFAEYVGIDANNLNSLCTDPGKLIQNQLDFLIYSSATTDYDIKEWYPNLASRYGAEYIMSFEEFTGSTDSAGDLAVIFNSHYERSGDNTERINQRREYAEKWFDYFSNK